MINFWQNLPKPFTVLAPMDDVTDVAFRELVAEYLPRPDVLFTEFVNADGLNSLGKNASLTKLRLTDHQKPVVAQIWGTNPDNLRLAAKMVVGLGFDGVDINMGCPVRAVMKKGAGAALSKNQKLAKEIIEKVKDGAYKLPVSVKTRLGVDKIITEEWISFLLSQKLNALTIHGRIAKQMSDGNANWDEIGKAVKLKDQIAPNTVLIGNGDIKNYQEVLEMHNIHGVDGVMIGRGIFHNPWVFAKSDTVHRSVDYLDLLLKHLDLYDQMWEGKKNFAMMKKFFKMYVKSINGANKLRVELMDCNSTTEARELVVKIKSTL